MDHRKAFELLPWYANQTLGKEEREALEEHLSQCEACRRRLESLQGLALSMTELLPQDAELAPDFFERRLKPLVRQSRSEGDALKENARDELSWAERIQRQVQSWTWRALGPVAALVMLLAASPYLVRTLIRQFSQPARLLLAEAPEPGIAAVELKTAKRSTDWPTIAVSRGEDYKRIILAVNPGPDDPEYSRYLFRLFQDAQGSQELSEAETEAADQVALFLKVSGLQAGRYVLQAYGKTDSQQPDPKPFNSYPFEIVSQ